MDSGFHSYVFEQGDALGEIVSCTTRIEHIRWMNGRIRNRDLQTNLQ